PPGVPGEHPARGALPRAAARGGLGLGGRLRHPDRGQPHQGAAPQDRRRAHPYRARRRVRPGDADAMSGGPAGRRGPGDPEPWGGVRPFSIKTKLGALVVVSVLITTDRKSTRLNSSHVKSSYAVYCLKQKKDK